MLNLVFRTLKDFLKSLDVFKTTMYFMSITVLCCGSVLAIQHTETGGVNSVLGDKNGHLQDVDPAEQLFKKLFKSRRAEQLDAVKGLLVMESFEKQFKMVNIIVEKVFSVIQNSRVLLESSGYVPGVSSFPKDESVLDALANILENTALFGDILLHLPDIAHQALASRREWQALLHWSLGFVAQSQLLDKKTKFLLDLVNMELNITERDAEYVNPYRTESRSKQKTIETDSNKKKKRKKELRKGPRMSAGEL